MIPCGRYSDLIPTVRCQLCVLVSAPKPLSRAASRLASVGVGEKQFDFTVKDTTGCKPEHRYLLAGHNAMLAERCNNQNLIDRRLGKTYFKKIDFVFKSCFNS